MDKLEKSFIETEDITAALDELSSEVPETRMDDLPELSKEKWMTTIEDAKTKYQGRRYDYQNRKPAFSCSWFVSQLLIDVWVKKRWFYLNSATLCDMYVTDKKKYVTDFSALEPGMLLFRKLKSGKVNHVWVITSIDPFMVFESRWGRDKKVKNYSYNKMSYFIENPKYNFLAATITKPSEESEEVSWEVVS